MTERACFVAAMAMCACGHRQEPTADAAVVVDLATPALGPDLSILCPGAQPSMLLVEGYCKAGEADRCFYAQPPADGF